MKLFLRILLFLIPFAAWADDFPARPKTLVSDFADVLSASEEQALESKLVAFSDSTSMQIAVVTMRSTGSYEISEYAVQLFNKWGIGEKANNSGVLVIAAIDDRNVFINTGYGMEGVLPDALCKRIVERDIVPNFKNGNYYLGLEQSTNSIIGLVKGEYTAADFNKKKKEKKGGWFFLVLFLFILVVTMASNARRVSRYSKLNNIAFWTAWSLLNAAANRNRGSWNNFTGGGWGGGGGGGFGGFGGFGGGGSGGGGAGGSW